MHATYGLVPISLIVILTASRSLGLVRMAQKMEAASKAKLEKKDEVGMTNVADPSKEKTN